MTVRTLLATYSRSPLTYDKIGSREHNDPGPPAMLAPNGSRESLITPTVLEETSEGGTRGSVADLANGSAPTDRDVSDTIGHYGIFGHRWVNRKLWLSVLQPKWMSADALEKDYPCLMNSYKKDKKITALRQSPRLNQPRS